MSNSKKIYAFRCGTSALYALTADSTGRNLPTHPCPAGWQFECSITLHLGDSSQKHELANATLAAIAKHGFYLTHTAAEVPPFATIHGRAETAESVLGRDNSIKSLV